MTDYSAQTYAQLENEILSIRRELARLYVKVDHMYEEIQRRAYLQEDFKKVQQDEVKRYRKKKENAK